jgi:hypothetical protein
MREDVQKFLQSYDNSGYQYTRRWNDLISQAVTVQMFMDRKKVYHFNDWCYEHTTFSGSYDDKNSITWGGIYPAVKNSKILSTNYIQKWQNDYKVYHKNTFDTLNVEDCLYKINIDFISKKILNNKETFRPLNNDDCYFLGKYDSIEDVYLAINDHWINCNTEVQRAIQFQYSSPVSFIWFHSESHGNFSKKLYAINNKRLLNKIEYNSDTTAFLVTSDIFVTHPHNNTISYKSNLTNNDQFVNYIFGNNYKGYYVEAGASDGILNSNTYFLENELGWQGLLVEPTSKFNDLIKNRPKSTNINCVLGDSNNNINFIEFLDPNYKELSCTEESFERLQDEDSSGRKDIISMYDNAQKNKLIKNLEQIRLDSLLDKVDAPNTIDNLS